MSKWERMSQCALSPVHLCCYLSAGEERKQFEIFVGETLWLCNLQYVSARAGYHDPCVQLIAHQAPWQNLRDTMSTHDNPTNGETPAQQADLLILLKTRGLFREFHVRRSRHWPSEGCVLQDGKGFASPTGDPTGASPG